MADSFTTFISKLCGLLWGDLFSITLPNGDTAGFSLMVLLLIPTGIYFTIRTKFLPIRMFPEMIRIALEKENKDSKKKENGSVSGMQTLIVATATRVGTGNLIGVVAAVSAGGAGAVSGCG